LKQPRHATSFVHLVQARKLSALATQQHHMLPAQLIIQPAHHCNKRTKRHTQPNAPPLVQHTDILFV
jgi:hypothetical protein